MHFPDAGRPDELAKVSERNRRWPFLEVRELLEERGVRVPELLAEHCESGWIVVEDLGDDTLAAYLERHPAERESIYRQAVLDLAAAQRSLATLPPGSIVSDRCFDEELLGWEIDHFREWGLEACGAMLEPAERERFDRVARGLAQGIAGWPRGFVHRDYQSRNLMVRRSATPSSRELIWIDFQDALLGPRVYDLVALLGDSYQHFDDGFIARRLDDYALAMELNEAERARVATEFDLVTVQRKLKDAGRFVFILHKKGDASYLEFIEPTLDKVRAALARLTDPGAADQPLPQLTRDDLSGFGTLLERALARRAR